MVNSTLNFMALLQANMEEESINQVWHKVKIIFHERPSWITHREFPSLVMAQPIQSINNHLTAQCSTQLHAGDGDSLVGAWIQFALGKSEHWKIADTGSGSSQREKRLERMVMSYKKTRFRFSLLNQNEFITHSLNSSNCLDASQIASNCYSMPLVPLCLISNHSSEIMKFKFSPHWSGMLWHHWCLKCLWCLSWNSLRSVGTYAQCGKLNVALTTPI